MPTIRLAYPNRRNLSSQNAMVANGPTLNVEIGLDPNFRLDSGLRPDLPQTRIPALVDTGAAVSGIDYNLAENLGLRVFRRRTVAGPIQSQIVNFYLAQIYIPALGTTSHGLIAGLNLAANGYSQHALIGRDILKDFTMFYNGRTSEVTISSD